MGTVALPAIHHFILGADFWTLQRVSPPPKNRWQAPVLFRELFWVIMAPGFQNLWKNSRRLSRRRPFPVSIRRASAGLPGAALSRVTCLRRNSVESLGHLVTPVSAGLAVVLVGSSAFRASVTASVCPTPSSKGFRGAPLRSVGRTDQPPPSQMPSGRRLLLCHRRPSWEVSQAPGITRDFTGHFFARKLWKVSNTGELHIQLLRLSGSPLAHGECEDRIQRKRQKGKKKKLFTVRFSSPTLSQVSWKAFRLSAAPHL